MKLITKPTSTIAYPGVGTINDRVYPRGQMADLLAEYNQSIGNDISGVEQLRHPNSRCVVTGQQLGFLGGPIYTIMKGISCVRYARRHNAIPIFWLATEDHDIGEIDHVNAIDPLGNIQKYHATLPKDGRFVEDLILTDRHITLINDFFNQFEMKSPVRFEVGSSYATSMASLLATLFKRTGLLFVEPRLLRPYASEIFAKELKEGGRETNVFFKTDKGLRRKITKDESGYHADGSLLDIEGLLNDEAERFSANFALRPVIQSALLPTEAYIAGPNEMLYYRRLKEEHQRHGIPMPHLVPRDHVTFIPPQIAAYLEACNLQPWDSIPRHWNTLFPDLEKSIDTVEEKWSHVAEEQLEGALSDQKIHRSVDQGLKQMRKHMRAKRLKEKGLPTDALHRMHNTLLPREKPQERVLSWWPFEAAAQQPLIPYLLENMEQEDPQQLYCYL